MNVNEKRWITEHEENVARGVVFGMIGAVALWAAILLGVFACWAAIAGCTITTKNQGETGVRYGTEITFFHRAAQTAPEPAMIRTEVPSLEEWIRSNTTPQVEGPLEPAP